MPESTDAPDTSSPERAHRAPGGSNLPWWARNSTQPYLSAKQVRLRTRRGVAGSLAFTLALLAGAWWVLTASEVRDVTRTEFGALAYKQTNNALIGGCGAMYAFPADEVAQESGTVPAKDTMGVSNRLAYRSVVPMFGQFWDRPVPDGQRFWDAEEPGYPVPERLLYNMWQGQMVVYYTAQVPDQDVSSLRRLAQVAPELDLLVVPWEESVRGMLPQGRELAFATWNASQSCHQLAVPAIYDFRELHPASEAPGHDGTEPPVLSDTPPLSVRSE